MPWDLVTLAGLFRRGGVARSWFLVAMCSSKKPSAVALLLQIGVPLSNAELSISSLGEKCDHASIKTRDQ